MKKTEGIIGNILNQDVKKIEIIRDETDNDKIEITADGKYVGKFLHYHPKIQGYDKFKDYDRHLIQLSHQSVIMIHHFSDVHEGINQTFEEQDMIEENEAAAKHSYRVWENSAQQFFNQLEGHYCDAFLETIIIEATKRLCKSDDRINGAAEKFGRELPNGPNHRAQDALDKAAKVIEKKD